MDFIPTFKRNDRAVKNRHKKSANKRFFYKNKNQRLLIEAFANLKLGAWKLLIVGDGDLKEEYEEMIKGITPIQKIETNEGGVGSKFCTNDTCEI